MKEWLDMLGERSRLPVFQQNEAAECGLACIGMLANYHGHRMNLAALRQRFPISSKGATLADLMAIADSLQLDTRALRLDLDSLGQLALPCVLHWDMSHFVVLVKVERKHITIHDPSLGKRRVSLQELGQHFTGVALEVSPKAQFVPEKVQHQITLKSLIGTISGLPQGILQVVALGLVLEVLAVTMPLQLQWVVDHAIPGADTSLNTVLALGFLLLIAVRSFTQWVRGWLIFTLSQQVNFQWLGHVLGHLLSLPAAYFEKRHLGAVLQNFHAVSRIQESLTTNFVQGLVDGFLVIGTLAMMLLYSPTLTAVAVAGVLVYLGIRLWFLQRLLGAHSEMLVYESRQETHLMETIRAAQTVRLYGRANERKMGWLHMVADQFNATTSAEKIALLQRTLHSMLFGFMRIILVWMAAEATLKNQFTVGMLFAFVSYQDQFAERISSLVDKVFELKMLKLQMNRLADIVHTEPENLQATSPQKLAQTPLHIELQHVSFRYAANEKNVLDDLNLTLQAGESVAITGPSGCGKTTLIKVLLGLLEPTEGQILVNGKPLGHWGLAQYRSQVSTVMQDDSLFTGSVADNISFFDPEPNLQHIEHCARMAAMDDDILDMPMGYQSLVGDDGAGFSGGQKQRLLLARALYRNPKLLVLDEATSHLDVDNERAVNAQLKHYPVTRIIVAHRPETIAMADRVVTMAQGHIKAERVLG